jgi:DNA-binding response OmpR family regulator
MTPPSDPLPKKAHQELRMFATAPDLSAQPCLLLAHAEATYAALAGRAFRRLGWDVYTVGTGPEVRRLARMLRPRLVVLDAELPDESGWLTCRKLLDEQPDLAVLLVAPEPTPRQHEFAAFVGAAALLDQNAGPNVLLQLVHGPEQLPASA